ncbi:MAG: T9SS type A sorting domain-containing protein [Bacteroidota bacterium]
MKSLFTLFVLLCVMSIGAFSQITSAATGNWNSTSTWVGGVVPGASDDVTIAHTVTIDIANAECKNLTVNSNLYFANTNGNGITVYGNCVVNAGKRFRMASATPASGQIFQSIDFKGNLTVASTGTFDMRQSSTAIGTIGRVRFSGSSNSTVSLSLTTYSSSSEEFNSVEIAKTGGAKVILSNGNMFLSNNSTNMPDTLVFTSGSIETQGSSAVVLLRTSSAAIVGYSANSYINGTLGIGVANSAGYSTRDFPIGDQNNYRPLSIKFDTPFNGTGHYVWAKVVSGNANNGSSTLNNGLNKISEVRYFRVGYNQAAGLSDSIFIDRIAASYGNDDGVTEGNTDVRVAYSLNNRATWTPFAQSVNHTTSLASPPTIITPDTLVGDTLSGDIGIKTLDSISVAIGTMNSSNPLPVELVAFTAATLKNTVELRWSTATEVNNAGFDVEKMVNGSWSKLGFVEGNGNSNVQHSYSFVDAAARGRESYRLKQMDRDGRFTYSSVVETSAPLTAQDYSLSQNYPNPFNPSTNISFAMKNAEQVNITVYNALGQAVETLFNGIANADELYTVSFNGKDLSSGVYYYSLRSASRNEVRKMLMMK